MEGEGVTGGTPDGLARQRIRESLATQQRMLEGDLLNATSEAAARLSKAIAQGRKLLAFGNGGSAADATHIAAELVGRFLVERRALPGLSLSDNTSAVTAIANDYGYDEVFSRQIEALGERGDVALGISTSGRSPNVNAGLRSARERGLVTIGLTGRDGGDLPGICDVCLRAPSDETPRIQECHVVLAHVLCELVECGI